MINFEKQLNYALKEINFQDHHSFIVDDTNKKRDLDSSCEIVEKCGDIKWQIVEILNSRYSKIFEKKFDLYNWINHQYDEVAYFLSETCSNCLSYAEFFTPSKFQVWLGLKGFIIAIEQNGKGFNAMIIDKKKIFQNEGTAFDFYRNCQSEIFFDNAQEAKVVYFMKKF